MKAVQEIAKVLDSNENIDEYEMTNEQFWELLRMAKRDLLTDLIDELEAIGSDERTIEVLKKKQKELSNTHSKQH